MCVFASGDFSVVDAVWIGDLFYWVCFDALGSWFGDFFVFCGSCFEHFDGWKSYFVLQFCTEERCCCCCCCFLEGAVTCEVGNKMSSCYRRPCYIPYRALLANAMLADANRCICICIAEFAVQRCEYIHRYIHPMILRLRER